MTLIIRVPTGTTVPDGSAQRIPVAVRNVPGTQIGQAADHDPEEEMMSEANKELVRPWGR